MKLTQMETEVFNYVKENGGRVSVDELVNALGRSARSIGANITGLSGEKKGSLLMREKVEVEGQEKPTTYAVLTENGRCFVPTEE